MLFDEYETKILFIVSNILLESFEKSVFLSHQSLDHSLKRMLNYCWHGPAAAAAAAAAESRQLCPTLCDPIYGSPPGSPVPGRLQARTLEWVAISFSNAWKWKLKVKLLSRVRLLATPWTAAYQAPPSMGFSRQEYWSGVPSTSPDMTLGHAFHQTLPKSDFEQKSRHDYLPTSFLVLRTGSKFLHVSLAETVTIVSSFK